MFTHLFGEAKVWFRLLLIFDFVVFSACFILYIAIIPGGAYSC